MKKNYILAILFFGLVSNSFSQKSLSDYSYVIVSEQFEFQKEKDKYQLNSLTKFLFNKYGFHAYFDREVPSNVNRCDGIWAEAEGTPGFIITKVQLILRDCNGTEIFRTRFGKSKVKDYKQAYYESMREAFEDLENLNLQQKEIKEVEIVIKKDKVALNKETPIGASTVIISKNEVNDKTPKEKSNNNLLENLPSSKYTNYSNSGNIFLLRKTSNGYSLYQEFNTAEDELLLLGKIIIIDSRIEFINTENQVINAFFDISKNLIIGDKEKKIIYKIED